MRVLKRLAVALLLLPSIALAQRHDTVFRPLQDGSGSITLDEDGQPVSFTTPGGATFTVVHDSLFPNPYRAGKTGYSFDGREHTFKSQPDFVVESMAVLPDLKSSDFGTWANLSNFDPSLGFNGPSGPRLQYYATGAGAGANLPKRQADYRGSFIGVIIQGNNASNYGDIALQVDFAQQTITASFSGVFASFHPTGPLGAYGKYSLTTTVGTSTLNVNGVLYGSKETTGILTGLFNSTGQIAGSFGAKTRDRGS